MTNDPPTSLRMGFGYKQARAAGLGGIRADRSPRQFNRQIEQNRAARELNDEIRKDVGWSAFVVHRIEAGCSAAEIADELYWLKRYARMRAKGFSAKHCLRCHWPYSR